MELDAVERPRPLTRVEKVLIDATPCVLDSGSTDPPGGYLLTFRPDLAKKFSYYWKSTPVPTWTLSVGNVQFALHSLMSFRFITPFIIYVVVAFFFIYLIQ